MHDSALEAGDLVRRGGGADVRLLSYEAGELSVELQVSASGANRTLLGEVIGGRVERIAVQTDGPGVEVQSPTSWAASGWRTCRPAPSGSGS